MKRSPLGPGRKSLERGSTFDAERKSLARRNGIGVPARPSRGFTPASKEQRRAVAGRACLVCASTPVDAAHLIDRSLGSGDDPRDVVPLCRRHHREYDQGALDLLPYLEPRYRTELARAVELVGLLRALARVTNHRWAPDTMERAA
jgi:hypothetical protein